MAYPPSFYSSTPPLLNSPGFLKNFNLKRQILMVSDKEVGGRNGFGRLIPLCSFLVEEIKKFLKFLEYFFDSNHEMSYPALSDVIQQISKQVSYPCLESFKITSGHH